MGYYDMENEVLNCLKSRRSCRSYLKKQVDPAALDAVLEAGTYAASGMGRQAGKIVVLQDPADIAALERMNAAVMGNPDGHPFYGAPTVLIVFADRNVFTHVEDGALVMGNLLNAAHAVGLSGCWIHRAREEFDSPEGKALMKKWGVGEEYVGIGHCILGYAAQEPAPARERKADFIVKV